ncbi:LuxR C-terminal-related transcriptional regulator [Streptomyces cinnabarinus]|uniref:LuxR C-terminal-related transcriptional regulator n=1 Tax=Streptomyces cinnabarinus TaxID=67287 RepID=A0ABY7KD35_9ACTN|nr:LuxR C-terminal-related transcriptional regulator [Streptomyces cinnabarinus]WAZ21530.1 LuxR C-terminal-related transcriptional regulator [Streptomyces cinnabarinus]
MGESHARRASGFPAELTSFVGRRDESADVRRLLTEARLVTLTGPGGVGKTRLASHVAKQTARTFPDGVWLVSLAALSDEAFVPHAVADALDVRNETGRPPLDVLVEHLRGRGLLLVLDNCEHVLRSCALLAQTLLAATEGVRVLATSRHRLGLAGEQLYEVPPLPAPTPEELGPSAAEHFPALRLFADRAAAVVPGFTVGEGNQHAVARLCRRLDGLPLAIELAAVRVRALGVDQLVARLDDRYQLLTGGSPASAPRHRTLRSAVDWSHELCTPQEQLVWAWLSVFVGGFDLAAAEAVCGGEGLGATDVLDAVAGLVDKSVLVREERGGQVRYRLLVSLRDYGLEKLEDIGEVTVTRRRHRDYFARLAAGYESAWFGPDQVTVTDRLRLDQDDFRAALDFCLTTPGEAQAGLRLAATLWFHWVASGIWGEGRHWLDRALRAGARPDPALTRAMWAGALMSLVHTRSAAVLAGADPPHSTPPADAELPVPAPPPIPTEVFGTGRAATTTVGFVVLTRVELACTLVSRGRAGEAIPLCAEAVAVCEAHGEQWARAWALRTLGLAHWSLGEYDRAAEHARACLRLPYTGRQRQSLARTLDLLAAAEALAGRAEQAAVLRGAVDRIWHDIGGDPTETRVQGAAERHTRSALGDPAYARAYRRGGALPRNDVIAYALGELRRPTSGSADAPDTRPLTRREAEVAALVARGLTNRQIAESLVIAQRTAEGHVERILVKLGFSKRSQLAAWFTARAGEG